MATYDDLLKLMQQAQVQGLSGANPALYSSLLGISNDELLRLMQEGPSSAAKKQEGSTALVPDPTERGGSGFGGGAPGQGKGSEMSGPMNTMESTLVGLMGSMMPSPIAGISPTMPMGVASKLADMLGVPREYDPSMKNVDPQSVRDYFGAFEESEARSSNAARSSMRNAETTLNPFGDPTKNAAMEAEAEAREAANSPEGRAAQGAALGGPNAKDPSTFGVEGGPKDSADATTSDPDSSGRSAQGDAGQQGMYKRGGVARAKKPTKVTFGEGGEGENAIFIPDSMKTGKRKGTKRDEVMIGLATELKELGKGSYLEEIMDDALAYLGGR